MLPLAAPIVTFVIPKNPEQGPRLFCRQNCGPRWFLVRMLGSAQVRACFAKKTVLYGKGFLAKCSGPGPRRICRENHGPCQVFLG